MKFEHTKVFNFDGAIRGMRNPLESWNKSDSKWNNGHRTYIIGEKDIELAQKLIKAGSEHRKFMRQIMVSVDITAPLYWWKEFETYKVGTTSNSMSTMHKITSKPITLDCFEIDDYDGTLKIEGADRKIYELDCITYEMVDFLDRLRLKYLETKDKRYWKELIRWLPNSWLQTRTITMSYENILNMDKQRDGHKLTEWSSSFIKWIDDLPYSDKLIKINY